MSVQAPQTRKQPSRKGRKAWRKNVDISDVQSGLEIAREEVIITGGKVFAELPAEELFQTDTSGSIAIQKQARKAHPLLRSEQIIAQRSAIPAVSSQKRSADARTTNGIVPAKRQKGPGVSHRELMRLKELAYNSANAASDIIQAPGNADHDPWAVSEPLPQDPTTTFLDAPKPFTTPVTLKHAPISLAASGKPIPAVRRPVGGRSYNPAFAEWDALVTAAGAKEVEAEKRRLRDAEEERLLEERVAAAALEAERELDAAEAEAYESEWEGIQSEIEDGGSAGALKKRPERKSAVDRNKIKRRKEAERLGRHEAKMKERNAQAHRIGEIKRSIDAAEAARAAAAAPNKKKQRFPGSVESDEDDDDDEVEDMAEEVVLRRRKFGKFRAPEAPLELVLADELQDSLRLLKPEGNLIQDRFRNMIVRGKVEARRPLPMQRQRKTTVTTKWSYKDWKAPGSAGI